MMLFDACFILYYIQYIFGEKLENCEELKSNQIAFIHQDLFLLENFVDLDEVMKVVDVDFKIEAFICDNILASRRPKRSWFNVKSMFCAQKGYQEEYYSRADLNNVVPDHLISLLHLSLTRKPSSTMSLTHVEFCKGMWWFSVSVKLPPITVNDSTKAMLNLIAYEMCSRDASYDAWVTSYICFMDTLIDHPEDVTALHKAGVVENCLGCDEEVAKLFNEIRLI
ncbi:hypothetical protein L1987_82276 [Smallanthus sonchifolius]|uniref:Uncharacterized protein n=1 Tax=Smallanthus sonchifolius TaxID=185202 RepID=A0ACB8YB40_9ASTR|nr:hypothetical protein L1987_82276 [Smallanthus sonchifolius]